jgi:serine/threonine protein kinase
MYNRLRKIKDYVLLEEIGQGAYSTVYKCCNILDGQIYACKKFRRSQMSKRMIQNLKDE